jgi:hypothetical protein
MNTEGFSSVIYRRSQCPPLAGLLKVTLYLVICSVKPVCCVEAIPSVAQPSVVEGMKVCAIEVHDYLDGRMGQRIGSRVKKCSAVVATKSELNA